jgi:uncharacterized protein (TIGR02118 family)
VFTLFLSRLANVPGALQYIPDRVRDPYLDDGAPPEGVTQIYFSSLGELERSAGQLGADEAEAMEVHRFRVPEPWSRVPERYCTYLVAYEGPADDEAAWLAYYLKHHPPLMSKLPGIRELEIYTPIDWRCPPSLRPVRHLQRNKVAFDNGTALAAALDSPIRREMRADFAQFPSYHGRVTHYAMTTRVLS